MTKSRKKTSHAHQGSAVHVGSGTAKRQKGLVLSFGRLIVIAFIVVFGGIGTYLLLASHADSSQVTCNSIGGGKYNCNFYEVTPVYAPASKNALAVKIGTIHEGTNWIICQQVGGELSTGGYHNKWWAYTLSDQNKYGWVNAVYGKGGVNDGSFEAAPNCNNAHGQAPLTPQPKPAPAPAPKPAPKPAPAPAPTPTPAPKPVIPVKAGQVVVSGRVYDTTTQKGIAGAKVLTCLSTPTSVTTDANGNWAVAVTSGAAFCAQISYTVPRGWTGPVLANNPEHSKDKGYLYQVAGVNDYHNAGVGKTSQQYTWDRATDTGYNFVYTSPKPICTTAITGGDKCNNGTITCSTGYFKATATATSCTKLVCTTAIAGGIKCNNGSVRCSSGYVVVGSACAKPAPGKPSSSSAANTRVVAYNGYNDGCGGTATHYASNRKTHVSQKDYGVNSVCVCNNGHVFTYGTAGSPVSDNVNLKACVTSGAAPVTSPLNSRRVVAYGGVNDGCGGTATHYASNRRTHVGRTNYGANSVCICNTGTVVAYGKDGTPMSDSSHITACAPRSSSGRSSTACTSQQLLDEIHPHCTVNGVWQDVHTSSSSHSSSRTTNNTCGSSDSFGDGCHDPSGYNCGANGQYHYRSASGCGCINGYSGTYCTTPPRSSSSGSSHRSTACTTQQLLNEIHPHCTVNGVWQDKSTNSRGSSPTCSSKGGSIGDYGDGFTVTAKGVCVIPASSALQEVGITVAGYYSCSGRPYVSSGYYNCHITGGLKH